LSRHAHETCAPGARAVSTMKDGALFRRTRAGIGSFIRGRSLRFGSLARDLLAAAIAGGEARPARHGADGARHRIGNVALVATTASLDLPATRHHAVSSIKLAATSFLSRRGRIATGTIDPRAIPVDGRNGSPAERCVGRCACSADAIPRTLVGASPVWIRSSDSTQAGGARPPSPGFVPRVRPNSAQTFLDGGHSTRADRVCASAPMRAPPVSSVSLTASRYYVRRSIYL